MVQGSAQPISQRVYIANEMGLDTGLESGMITEWVGFGPASALFNPIRNTLH